MCGVGEGRSELIGVGRGMTPAHVRTQSMEVQYGYGSVCS